MARPLTLVFVFLLVTALVPCSSTALSGAGWQRSQSENFIVFSHLDEAATTEIVLDLERLRAVLEEMFPNATFDSPLDTLIYIFEDAESVEPYALGGGQAGFFVPHRHANFAVVVGSQPGEALPVVYRQYLHDVVNNNLPQAPPWLRHGLAEIFSTFEADGETARVALAARGEAGLSLEGSERMPVGELLSLEAVPGDASVNAFTHGAWALVHYLLIDDEARFEAARRWVGELERNPTSNASITDFLGADAAALDASVAAYVASSPMPHREMPLPTGVPREVTLAHLDPHAALFHLGDLLIHIDPSRQAEARAHFDAALEAAPDFAPAIAGLGLVSEIDGDLGSAERSYLRALEEYPEAFRLQVLFGQVELALLGKKRPQTPEEQARLDQAVVAFRKCVELRPDYGEGWAQLGLAYNLQVQPAPEAVPTLERAYEMLPGRGDVAYNLLLAYARAGKRQEAIDLVATAEARRVPEEQLAPARQTLLQLDFQYAVALVRERKYDEAAGLLEQVAAEAGDPRVRQQAADLLGQIKR